MTENDKLQMFEDRPIRTAWDETQEEWYFSVVDVVAALTEQTEARKASTYWAVLKKRLKIEGASELLTNCKRHHPGDVTAMFAPDLHFLTCTPPFSGAKTRNPFKKFCT